MQKLYLQKLLNNHYEKHIHMVSIEKLDGYSTQHFNSYSHYCSEHKKNLCAFCIDEQHNHCRLSKIENFTENEKNDFLNEINTSIKIKKEIEEFQKQINERFDELKRKMDEIIFLKNFLFSYEIQKQYFIYNYNILHNLKEVKYIVKHNQIKKYEFISKYANKLINLLKKGNFKTITKHTNYVDHIKILPDGRLVSCSEDGTINIYNKRNYEFEQKIKVGSGVVYIESLSNNNIIACCFDGALKIYDINNDDSKFVKQIKGHKNIVLKVLKINNKLISCSRDKTMKIWERNEHNNYNCIKTITISDNCGSNTNILQINKNEIITAAQSSNYIKFFDIKNDFKEITTIKNISINWSWNSLLMINETILLIGGFDGNGIYLIDIINHQIISNIYKEFGIYSAIKLKNGNILIGCYENNNHSLVEFKFDNSKKDLDKIKSKEFVHSNTIVGLIEVDDGSIISCSSDFSIKFWV